MHVPRDASIPRQLTAAEIPDRSWDVVVVGAGPAGATAALTLARRGRRVLLLDRARFPRDKVCGDALIPDALRCLSSLGLLEAVQGIGHSVSVISIYSAARVRLDVPGTFVTVARRTLDAFLAAKAVDAGACLATARVEAWRPCGAGVEVVVENRATPIGARGALIATGAQVDLLQAHGLVSRPRASAMAVRCYVRSSERIDELVISYDHSIAPGYAWIFPIGHGLYNVGCGRLVSSRGVEGMNLRRDLSTFLERFPLARALMARATETSKLQGAMLRCGLTGTRPVGPGRALSIGESIGATFPLTGEGIGKAMETACMGAEALHRSLDTDDAAGLAGFGERLRVQLGPRYLGYAAAERWITWPRVGDFVLRRAGRNAYLRGAIQGILDETVDPRTVFSVRGLARSWWVPSGRVPRAASPQDPQSTP